MWGVHDHMSIASLLMVNQSQGKMNQRFAFPIPNFFSSEIPISHIDTQLGGNAARIHED
jgi:hypothetical protein